MNPHFTSRKFRTRQHRRNYRREFAWWVKMKTHGARVNPKYVALCDRPHWEINRFGLPSAPLRFRSMEEAKSFLKGNKSRSELPQPGTSEYEEAPIEQRVIWG